MKTQEDSLGRAWAFDSLCFSFSAKARQHCGMRLSELILLDPHYFLFAENTLQIAFLSLYYFTVQVLNIYLPIT